MLREHTVGTEGDEGLPCVSVIVLNYNGKKYLDSCLASLSRMDYPEEKLELILVDNGSTDGSVAYVKASFPWVRIVRNHRNLGFTKANNIGATEAGGQYVAFLNNDMRVDSRWLTELVGPMDRERGVVCTASKILSWDGKTIDFVGGALNFYGHAFQLGYQRSNIEEYTEERPLLFACGGAMLINREVFLGCGGFDEDYFAFFEDVDLGWRLWILGHKVLFAPKAVVYHKHHGTSKRIAPHARRVLYERNALYTIMKNYEEENLHRILPAALLLAVKRTLAHGNLERRSYEIDVEGIPHRCERIPKIALSHLVALDEFADNMPRTMLKRVQVQKLRKRCDKEIFTLFRRPFESNYPGIAYMESQSSLSDALHIADIFSGTNPPHVLIISHDHVGKNMAGPAIRCWEIANALGKTCDVTLATPGHHNTVLTHASSAKIRGYQSRDDMADLAADADVILVSGYLLRDYPCLLQAGKLLVADLYDPFTLENLIIHTSRPLPDRVTTHKRDMEVVRQQLKAADFFICASERQRDFWVGVLLALGRLNPHTYDDDETLHKLIDVVPFGIPSTPPQRSKRVLKGVHSKIRETDRVILWGGGIWDWFDPRTLIRAMARIVEQRDDVRLFFMGITHPNPLIPEMKATVEAIQLSKELGLHNEFIFFNEWVPYEERQNYLLEADIGVSLHLDHIETRFSFRTRLLDYIWAGIPIVATRGDCVSALVERYQLGRVVDYEHVAQVTEALLELLDTPDLRETCQPHFREVGDRLTWEKAVEPLVNFCANPHFASDKAVLGSYSPSTSPGRATVELTPWWMLPSKVWEVFRHDGLRILCRETRNYLILRSGAPSRFLSLR